MMKIKELKQAYEPQAIKYKLPSFQKLNEDFEIEVIKKESETILRTVRKTMTMKITNAINFLEMVLNPVNAPRFYLVLIKSMGAEGKKEAEKIYNDLTNLIKGILLIEVEYSEEKEAEMIRKIYSTWNSIKPNFKKMLESVSGKDEANNLREKSYFG